MNRSTVHLLKYFKAQRVILSELGLKVFSNASRPDVHQLRIAVRRSRAVLWILKNSSPPLPFDKLDQRLRKLGHLLGAARELDMAIKDAKKYEIDPLSLKLKRKVKVKSLRRHLKEKRRQKLSREMATVIKDVRSQNELELGSALGTLRKSIVHWQKRRLHGSARLHKFRIAIKKTRYVLEALGRPVESLKDVQSLLGKAHDLETLQHFVGRKRTLKRDRSSLAAAAIRLAGPTLQRVTRKIDSSYR